MKRMLVILLSIIICVNLIACSDTTKFKDKELYDDSIKIYNMVSKHYEDKTVFTIQEREIYQDYEDEYLSKYKEQDLEYKVVNSLMLSFLCVDMYTFCLENSNLGESEKWKDEYKKQLEILKEVFDKE